MSVLAIVQARMGSSRLPGKSLRSLCGKPIIQHVLERVSAVRGVDRVLLATTVSPKDDALAHFARTQGYYVWRHGEQDVLARYLTAANLPQAWAGGVAPETIMRVTGDCPLLATDVAEEVLQAYFDDPLHVGFVSNDTTCSGYPDGTDVEVFSYALLTHAHALARSAHDREHVTAWMRREVCNAHIKCPHDWSRYKLSIDRIEDYTFALTVMARIPRGDYRLATTMRVVEEVTGATHV